MSNHNESCEYIFRFSLYKNVNVGPLAFFGHVFVESSLIMLPLLFEIFHLLIFRMKSASTAQLQQKSTFF